MAKFYKNSSVENHFLNDNKSTIGKEFEDLIYFYMCKIYNNAIRHLGDDLDTKQGTDIEINEIRIDVTLNFSNKDYMPFVYETKIEAFPGEYFKIGIRHGNSHYNAEKKEHYNEFDKAVIVVGLDIRPKDYYLWDNVIIDNLSKDKYNKARKLVYEIEKAYDDYRFIDEQERIDYEIEHILKGNKDYEEPGGLGEFYKEHNEFQKEL